MDGLRAVAVALVMLFHARTPYFSSGFLGVDVFFVLSGYLITSLLLAEMETTGRIDIRRFYIRRLLRLTPALLTMLAGYLGLANVVWPDVDGHFQQAAIAAAYLSDYSVAFWATPEELSHTWSLAVEEHFYLVWPLFLVAVHRRNGLSRLLAALICMYILSIAWRCAWIQYGHTWNQIYYRFDTHASGLLLGSGLAVVLRLAPAAACLSRQATFLVWLPLAGIAFVAGGWGDYAMLTWGISLAEWATVFMLIAVYKHQGIVFKIMAIPVLVWVGRLSYGLYLWHYPRFRALRDIFEWHDVLLVGVPVSLGLAATSFYSVERWALQYRKRLTSKTPPSESTSL
jgi:peptidoglycan/LPS O-acetylase OafA/YrhL